MLGKIVSGPVERSVCTRQPIRLQDSVENRTGKNKTVYQKQKKFYKIQHKKYKITSTEERGEIFRVDIKLNPSYIKNAQKWYPHLATRLLLNKQH